MSYNENMTSASSNLIWIDLEMTGLSPERERIIEIATVVTDSELKLLAEGPVLALSQPESILAEMDDWNRNQHSQSGLLQRVRDSSCSEAEAERLTLEFLRQYAPAGASPMCGNSICLDRRFLYRYMPELERYFHYRNLDVSTVKELVKRWTNNPEPFDKEATHLALNDIRDSIDELRHYRELYFRC